MQIKTKLIEQGRKGLERKDLLRQRQISVVILRRGRFGKRIDRFWSKKDSVSDLRIYSFSGIDIHPSTLYLHGSLSYPEQGNLDKPISRYKEINLDPEP